MTSYTSLASVRAKARNGDRSPRRRGHAVLLVSVTLPVLLGAAALTVDVGYMYLVRQELQTAADAGAMAAAWTLIDEDGDIVADVSEAEAMMLAALNSAGSTVEVTFGWVADPFDPLSPFVPAAPDAANAIRVTTGRTSETANPLELFFAGIFGFTETDVGASAISSYAPVAALDGIPVALRVPGFGPVDPDIVEANPGKDGPSEPLDGEAFQIGEQVTVFTFGKGSKSPVHLVLNTNDIPGEAQLGKVLRGEDPPVPLAVGDEVDVMGEGTGHNGLGVKLADRLDDLDPANDTVVLPIVETLPTSRDEDGDLDGNVRIVDFVAVHLDAIIEVEVPDPKHEGNTIDIELLVGTVVQRTVSGTAAPVASGFVNGVSVGIPLLIR